jgi:3-oxoacyl-[acyl-carrier-protein] synthase-3
MPAYITGLGVCLPNQPIANDQIESVLGVAEGRSARVKDIILKRNGIKSRHYVIDPKTGKQTHTNAQLTAEAVLALAKNANLSLEKIESLTCGTSSPDQLIPGHASMVHGLVGCPPCEVITTGGVCVSGMTSLKYAYVNVLSGTARAAVATGSEVASTGFAVQNFKASERSTIDPESNDYASFDREFLRWMLSDGAGAMLVEPAPRAGGLSFRIEFIDIISLANELDTCMYCGAVKAADGSLRTYRELDNFSTSWQDGFFTLAQDVKLLNDSVVALALGQSFERVRRRRELTPEGIDWLLPHLSSYIFQKPTYDMFQKIGFGLPMEKWFTNLGTKGNTGSASIYIMLEELRESCRLKPGQRLLCIIPESARFTFAYMVLTVV